MRHCVRFMLAQLPTRARRVHNAQWGASSWPKEYLRSMPAPGKFGLSRLRSRVYWMTALGLPLPAQER
jgi:hypothetical protein